MPDRLPAQQPFDTVPCVYCFLHLLSSPVHPPLARIAQGHHQRPWTITKREFCNNVHQVFKPATYPAGLFLLLSPLTPLWWNAFISPFIFLVCMSQQFHAWSHMKKSELPDFVLQLQVRG